MDSEELVKAKLKELEGHKQRKLTKAEKSEALISFVAKYVDDTLKEGRILNMKMGSELAYQMMLDYINSGHGIVEVKSFIDKNLIQEGKEAMSKVLEK